MFELKKLAVRHILYGSKPQITEAHAYRMKVDKFDKYCNMATFKLDKIDMDLLPPTGQEVLSLFKVLAEAVNGELGGRGDGWTFPSMCVAGGSALALLESHMMTTRRGHVRGRWEKYALARKEQKGSHQVHDMYVDVMECENFVGSVEPETYSVNDVDIFVGGKDGESDEGFERAVWSMVQNIKAVCSKKGKTVRVGESRKNLYVRWHGYVLIKDVFIDGHDIKLSFIQCPDTRSINDCVRRFDIDVCQVMFNPYLKELYADMRVVTSIDGGDARAVDFRMSDDGPDDIDIGKVVSTLERIRKYRKRGYQFDTLFYLRNAGMRRPGPIPRW